MIFNNDHNYPHLEILVFKRINVLS